MRYNHYNIKNIINIMLIIEDGYNTSYIYTVILGLFYKKSNISELLNIDPNNQCFIYIQEFIKFKILEPIRNNISINSATINEFRNYISICDWIKPNNTILELRNIAELYIYLMNGLTDMKIKIEILNNNNIDTLLFDYIQLELNNNNDVNTLFKSWILNNILKNNNKYKLKDIPYVLPFMIVNNNKNNLDIFYKITFSQIDDIYQKHICWNINSIICFDNNNKNYYVIIHKSKNKWLLFNDHCVPSLKEINLTDFNIIQKECVCLFYTL